MAAVGGAISWSEYEKDANALMWNFWQLLWQTTGQPSQIVAVSSLPFRTPFMVTPAPAAILTKACATCGAGLAADWKACPYCGTAIA